MLTHQKETPGSGCNHCTGVNTQNESILRVLATLERIAAALEDSNDHARNQTRILNAIADTLNER
jgi:hypothetical protein